MTRKTKNHRNNGNAAAHTPSVATAAPPAAAAPNQHRHARTISTSSTNSSEDIWSYAEESAHRAMSLRQRFLSEYVEPHDEISVATEFLPHHRGPPEAEKTPLGFWHYRVQDLITITHLAFNLYSYLFLGLRWYFKFLRLVAFTVLLLPGFAQMIFFYFFSPRLLRSVPYHPKDEHFPRNRLDVYLPRHKYRKRGHCPVIIYVTGGAWTIGYKAWGALIGRRLSQRGVVVFCLDYRNFPQGKVMDMVEDVNRGICWVLQNAHRYGGDINKVFLIGQSAGGHLTSLALLAQARRQASAATSPATAAPATTQRTENADSTENTSNADVIGEYPAWDPRVLRGYVGVSGAYNLVSLAVHLQNRGLTKNLFNAMMAGSDGKSALKELSPALLALEIPPEASKLVPKVLLLHGSADKSVPLENAEAFCAALRAVGVRCVLKTYVNKTHTQPIVEDPMRGARDELLDEVLGFVRGKPCYNRQFPMLPNVLIDIATWICPF